MAEHLELALAFQAVAACWITSLFHPHTLHDVCSVTRDYRHLLVWSFLNSFMYVPIIFYSTYLLTFQQNCMRKTSKSRLNASSSHMGTGPPARSRNSTLMRQYAMSPRIVHKSSQTLIFRSDTGHSRRLWFAESIAPIRLCRL